MNPLFEFTLLKSVPYSLAGGSILYVLRVFFVEVDGSFRGSR